MSRQSGALWVRTFIVVVAATILAVAAFGLGLTVGVGAHGALAQEAPPGLAVGVTPLPPTPQTAGEVSIIPQASTPTLAPTPNLVLDTRLFDEAMGLLKEQFYGNLPQGEDVTYNAIRGVVDRLGDRNTVFVDPKTAAELQADMEGYFEGIGARVGVAEMGGVLIEYLFPDQPAERAGLKVGDVVVAVDGKDVTNLGLTEAIGKIRGPRGSEVVLTYQRDGEKQDITVVRARIENPVIRTETLADGKVEYIALSDFNSLAAQRLADAMQKALDKKPAGLILDLRGNPGGLLDAAVRIGSYFVPEGNIVIERTKAGEERVYERRGRYLLRDAPLVVLVDNGSASASEIVAGAIQDVGTGVLIGERTYGKGSVQLPNTLSDGSQLRVTIAHWFTPKNRGIHGTGLEPDITVEVTDGDRQADRDPQLDRAVEYLLEGK